MYKLLITAPAEQRRHAVWVTDPNCTSEADREWDNPKRRIVVEGSWELLATRVVMSGHVEQSLGADFLETVLMLKQVVVGPVSIEGLLPNPTEECVSESPLLVV
jgi:hypothetical protein